MKAVYKSTSLSLCLILGACGNKGDLYLEPVELTEEQKAMLSEFDTQLDEDKTKKKKNDPANSSKPAQ